MNEKAKLIIAEAKKRPKTTAAWGALIFIILMAAIFRPGQEAKHQYQMKYAKTLQDTTMIDVIVRIPAYQWELVKTYAKINSLDEGLAIGKMFEVKSSSEAIKSAVNDIRSSVSQAVDSVKSYKGAK